MLTVAEIADQLGVSRVTIYNHIKANDKALKKHITKIKSVKHIDTKGFEILQRSIESVKEIKDSANSESSNPTDTNALKEVLNLKNEQLNDLKEQIAYLQEQISKKDTLITAQSRQLENAQVLQLKAQEKLQLLGSAQSDEIAITQQEHSPFRSFLNRLRGKINRF